MFTTDQTLKTLDLEVKKSATPLILLDVRLPKNESCHKKY